MIQALLLSRCLLEFEGVHDNEWDEWVGCDTNEVDEVVFLLGEEGFEDKEEKGEERLHELKHTEGSALWLEFKA